MQQLAEAERELMAAFNTGQHNASDAQLLAAIALLTDRLDDYETILQVNHQYYSGQTPLTDAVVSFITCLNRSADHDTEYEDILQRIDRAVASDRKLEKNQLVRAALLLRSGKSKEAIEGLQLIRNGIAEPVFQKDLDLLQSGDQLTAVARAILLLCQEPASRSNDAIRQLNQWDQRWNAIAANGLSSSAQTTRLWFRLLIRELGC